MICIVFVGLGLKKQNKEDAGNAPELVCRVIDAHRGASPDPQRSPKHREPHAQDTRNMSPPDYQLDAYRHQ